MMVRVPNTVIRQGRSRRSEGGARRGTSLCSSFSGAGQRKPRGLQERGIALIIVMIVIVVLGILAGGFAYSMKVETRLARNASLEPDLEWLGRAGVELARYVLSLEASDPAAPWDSLNKKWAGGPGNTNELLMDISLEDNQLGIGTFSVSIVDRERKYNVNVINEGVVERAFDIVGADPGLLPTFMDSYIDWLDPNDDPGPDGAETDYYMGSPNPPYPPYVAKNGVLDHISELLLIKGVTPELYFGLGSGAPSEAAQLPELTSRDSGGGGKGLRDLFTAVSIGLINPNTAPAEVLQMVPGMDEGLAQGVVVTRAGPDGVDGTEDDLPFASPGELINVPGMDRQIAQIVQRYFTIRSYTFEVRVQARASHYQREYVALLRRNNARDIQVLYFYAK